MGICNILIHSASMSYQQLFKIKYNLYFAKTRIENKMYRETNYVICYSCTYRNLQSSNNDSYCHHWAIYSEVDIYMNVYSLKRVYMK